MSGKNCGSLNQRRGKKDAIKTDEYRFHLFVKCLLIPMSSPSPIRDESEKKGNYSLECGSTERTTPKPNKNELNTNNHHHHHYCWSCWFFLPFLRANECRRCVSASVIFVCMLWLHLICKEVRWKISENRQIERESWAKKLSLGRILCNTNFMYL